MSTGMVNGLEAMARRWGAADRAVASATQRLSSGRRIVSAADNAAGLGIAERLRGQAAGALQAQRNVKDGIGALQTVDGALAATTGLLQRTRELAVQYQNDTLTAADRAAAQREADALRDEVARLAAQTQFNGRRLLGGGAFSVHVGAFDPDSIAAMLPDLAQSVAADVFSLDGSGTTTTTTVTTTTTNGGSNAGGNGNGRANGNGRGNGNANGHANNTSGALTVVAQTITVTSPSAPAIARIDAALDAVSAQRAQIGAFQNRLEHALGSLATTHEQLVATESRIRDADVAEEVVSLTRHRIRADVSRSLSAHAHVRARDVLQLLAA